MLLTKSFIRMLTVLIGIVVVFSCSDNGDKRKEVIEELGQPDDIVKSEYAGMKSELYVFARKDINKTYEFRKTTGGCGGEGDWYVYRMYYTNYIFPDIELYLPPTIVHTPVTTAPPKAKIPIKATVTDDVEVITVTLFYRIVGQTDFFEARMFFEDQNVYAADIPADMVTEAGIEYYIQAWDSGHSSDLPKKGHYSIKITSAAKEAVAGVPQTTERVFKPGILSRSMESNGYNEPVAP